MIEVREIEPGSPEHMLMVELRRQVLRLPLGLDLTGEDLDAERDDFHLAAFDGLELVGGLILAPHGPLEIKMRQVAVVPGRQGQGIGAKLVRFSEDFARAQGFERMVLNARDTAVPFYVGLGYDIEGEPFEEVTIPHRHMAKDLLSEA